MPAKLGRDRPDDGLDMARGVVVGMVIGLAFWLAIIGLAWVLGA